MVQLSHDRSLILEIAQFYLLALEVDNLNCAFGNVHVYHADCVDPYPSSCYR